MTMHSKPKSRFPLATKNASTLTAACALFAATLGITFAATTAYEPFNYTSGNTLPTTEPATGSGLTGNWGGTNTASVLGTSLSNPYTLAASANGSVSLTGTTAASGNGATSNRSIALTTSVSSGTLWFGFLMSSSVETNRTLNFGLTVTGTQPTFGRSNSANAPLGSLSLNFNSSFTTAPISNPIPLALNTTVFIVGRVEFDYLGALDSDRVSMWVVPDNGEINPDSPYTSNLGNVGTVNGFVMQAFGSQNANATLAAAGTFDEVHFGTDLASVANVIVVPEPSSALLGLAGLGALTLRRRRK